MREWLGELIDPDQIARELKPDNPRGADLSAGREAVRRIRSLIQRRIAILPWPPYVISTTMKKELCHCNGGRLLFVFPCMTLFSEEK
ncbi:hypothetical protein ACWGPW_22430 [Paenibacillus chitinolyticus]